jgi:putative redox protein
VDGEPIGYALFAHCFTCSKNLKSVGNISRALTRERIGVLRFDFTGLGESEGEFADTNFSTNVSDLEDAAAFLEKEYEAPRLLVGHSLGGTAVLRAAQGIPSSKAVVTIAAPSEPKHIETVLENAKPELEEKGEAEVRLAGRTFTVKKQLLEDLKATRVRDSLAALGRALLILHSPSDDIVGIRNATEIFKAARHPKSFISLDGADHLLSDEKHSLYAGAVLGAWARRYMDENGTEPDARELTDNRVVACTGESGLRTEVVAAGRSFVADEPVSVGGTGMGPSPYDILVAALGACTSMTLRMYADRKDWPLQSVTVRLDHAKIHAKDCAECETEKGKLDRIEKELELEGDLDDEQRKRLLEIADKCPVHRTLLAEEILIDSRLKQSGDRE